MSKVLKSDSNTRTNIDKNTDTNKNTETNIEWTDHETYSVGIFKNIKLDQNTSIAGFDLDHTIIMPKFGTLFTNKQPNEWLFLPNITDKIKASLRQFDSKFVIVTNQKNLNKKPLEIQVWKNKVNEIVKIIDEPCLILVSFCSDRFRKPSPFILKDNYTFKITNSFYCGDAGGIYVPRNFNHNGKIIKHEKDFSDTDYKFALNLGIKFIHRDEYCYNDTSRQLTITYPKFETDTTNDELNLINYQPTRLNQPEMIILVGMAGCGKSTMADKYAKLGYNIVNQDTLKTSKRCIAMAAKLVNEKKYLVIDNTNPAKKTRQIYIQIAKQGGYSVKCIYLNTSKEICKHNNIYRSIKNSDREIVPDIAYNMFKKNFEMPTKDEGIEVIILNYACDKTKICPQYTYYYF